MLKYSSFLICVVFAGYSSAAFVESLPKCSVKDSECLKKMFTHIFEELGRNGNADFGIPVADPFELNNFTVSLFGAVDFTMVKGTVKGMSNCYYDVYTVDIEKGSGRQEVVCSAVIEGLYNIKSNAIVKTLLNADLHGNGHGKITIDEVRLSTNLPVSIQKRDDGEIYWKVDYADVKYEYDIKKTHFEADNVILGDVETSETAMALLNHNEKFITKTFGKPFVDKAAQIAFEFCGKFLDAVPAKYFISDDLNSIAKP